MSSSLCSLFSAAASSSFDERTALYLDSSADEHMVCQRDWITDFTSIPPTSVRLGDNKIIEATGKSKLLIKLSHPSGTTEFCFNSVYYVPNLAKNLLSPNCIVEKGYIGTHSKDGYTMYNPTYFRQSLKEDYLYLIIP